ncbi:MAG: T9SS C-terminal target domain-containing protein [Balneola sp.]|nr:MAG: T9SS C-terminal target domain-containing protein [Balneola sp.]
MLKHLLTLLLAVLLAMPIIAQDSLHINLVENHNNWGWEAWVMDNGLISISTVPAIGARIMEYDLGNHSSIFVNPDELGNTYTPESNSEWPNFGGFKNWPAPQSRWNWPPPPTLDFGVYEADTSATSDSISITVTSPVEQWRAADLRFQRRTTMYRNTSRVKVEQIIINEGSSSQEWSVWDVTQNITNHPGETDFENFWVYFPINPNSLFGDDGVKISANSSAWVGEVADGIYGVQFKPEAKKIFADSHIGWIAYVDERENYVYAKTFQIDEEAEYPDDGARVEVWINNNPYYLEVEVLSPIVSLSANGGNYTFTEDWWAAKIEGGPVLSVTNAGAATRFEYSPSIGRLTGAFGVFHEAYAQLEYLDSSGGVITSTNPIEVSPLETFVYDEPFSPLEGVDSVRMVLVDEAMELIGVLISESVEVLLTSSEEAADIPATFELMQNYPNPFNPTTTIGYVLPKATEVKLEVFTLLGQSVTVLENGFKTRGSHSVSFDASALPSGVYLYRISAGEFADVRRMVLVK